MLARATQGRHEQLPLRPEGILGNVVLLVISGFGHFYIVDSHSLENNYRLIPMLYVLN